MGGTLKKKIGIPAPPKIRKITYVRAKRALKFRFLGKRVQKYQVINDFPSIFSTEHRGLKIDIGYQIDWKTTVLEQTRRAGSRERHSLGGPGPGPPPVAAGVGPPEKNDVKIADFF